MRYAGDNCSYSEGTLMDLDDCEIETAHSDERPPGERYTAMIDAQPKDRLVEFLVSLCLQHDKIGARVSFEFVTCDKESVRQSSVDCPANWKMSVDWPWSSPSTVTSLTTGN